MVATALVQNLRSLSKPHLVPALIIPITVRVHERVTSFSYRHVFSRMCE
jgi:hypothetical protein